jgi:hypothetical protein
LHPLLIIKSIDASFCREKALCGFDCLVIVLQSTLGIDDVILAKKALAYKQNVIFVRSQCDVDFVKMNEDDELKKTELKDLFQMAKRIEERNISQQATHFVAGYEWDIFLALKLIIPVSNNEDERIVLQNIKVIFSQTTYKIG